MSSQFSRVTINEISTLITKGTTPTSIGGKFSKTGIPFVKVESISESGGLIPEKFAFIDAQTDELLKRSRIQENDVLFSIAGTIGRVALVDSTYKTMNTNQAIALIRPDKNKIDSKFLYFSLRDIKSLKTAKSKVVQSVQANFSLGELKKLEIDLPSKSEQKAISHILGTLDKKIELNRKTNKNLEEIAKALFKSWFIDFDPIRAKAEDRPTGLQDEINDLFPDSFEDSELGEIPYSWGNIPLSDLIISIKERQGEQNLDEFSATISGIEHRDKKFKKVLAKSSNKNKVAIEGDLVFGLSRKVLNFGRMSYSIGGFSSVYEVFRSKNKINIPTEIIEKYIRTRMSKFMDILKPAAREGQTIDRAVLLQKRIPNFPSDLCHYFQSISKSIDSMISLKSREIATLEKVRDKLTSKLVSGELRIPDAEKMIEEVEI